MLKKIAAYETDNYGVRLCEISYDDCRMLDGCVFAFAGDVSRLKTVEEYELEKQAFQDLDNIPGSI